MTSFHDNIFGQTHDFGHQTIYLGLFVNNRFEEEKKKCESTAVGCGQLGFVFESSEFPLLEFLVNEFLWDFFSRILESSSCSCQNNHLP